MQIATLFQAAIAALLIGSTAAQKPDEIFCPPHPSAPADPERQRAAFDDFVNLFYVTGDMKAAFLTYVDTSYIQHNPMALSGRDNAIAFLTRGMGSGSGSSNSSAPRVQILNKGLDGDSGFVHYRIGNNAIVDVFGLNRGCVMEHWDVQQARPANATNPLAMW